MFILLLLLVDLFDMFPRDMRWFIEPRTTKCSLCWEFLMDTDIMLNVKVTWLITRNMLFHGAEITPVGYFEACRMSNSMKLSRWDDLKWIVRFGVYDFRRYLWFYLPSFHSPLCPYSQSIPKMAPFRHGSPSVLGSIFQETSTTSRTFTNTLTSTTTWTRSTTSMTSITSSITTSMSSTTTEAGSKRWIHADDSGRILHKANIHQIQPTCCVKTQGMKFGIFQGAWASMIDIIIETHEFDTPSVWAPPSKCKLFSVFFDAVFCRFVQISGDH